jgi:hypothetical protein
MPVVLTKSRYVQSVRCARLAWLAEHNPDVLERTSAHMLEGQRVGEFARTLYPDGILVKGENALEQTQAALATGKPVFEATFQVNNEFCKVDILVPTSAGYEVLEVKSSTSVKPDHKSDVSFQANLLTKAGLNVTRAAVVHVNKDFRKRGPIDPNEFFTLEDVHVEDTSKQTANALRVLASDDPRTPIGSQCGTSGKRSECPAKAFCWQFLPDDNVLQLYHDKKIGFALLDEGVQTITAVPDGRLEGRHLIQQEALKTNAPVIDEKPLRIFLDKLVFPLYFFDLETIGPAMPLHDGAKPYQAIPFQFSLHVLEENGTVTHHEFLADKHEPRRGFANALAFLGETGTILAYNAGFEKGVLRDLAVWDEELAPRIDAINSRFVDLIDPFKQFWYYHPAQQGSCSLKAVLPALTGISYEHLDIKKGDVAASEYYRVTYENPAADDKAAVREALLRYCELDTHAMLEIYRVLVATVHT